MANSGLEDLENEPLNEERMRRMKSLMRQLYKEEFESKRIRLPPVKGSGVIVFVSFVSIILFSATTLYNYNLFVSLREKVWSAQAHVEAAVQRRINLFANLVNLTLNHAELEREVFRHVADVRQDLQQPSSAGGEKPALIQDPGGAGSEAKTPDLAKLMQEASSGGLSRLLAVVEQYPDIKSSSTYKDLMASLLEIENRIVTFRVEANEEARIYNTLISSFPWYLLARLTGFEIESYYSVGAVAEKIPALTATSFKRLLPDGEPGTPQASQSLSTAPAKEK